MSRRGGGRWAAALAVLALAAAGCGDEPVREPAAPVATGAAATPADAYISRVRVAIRAMQEFARHRESLDAVPLRTAAPRLAEAAADFHQAVEDLAPQRPPRPYRDAHESIVGAMRGLDPVMGELAAIARRGDEAAFTAADERFRSAAQRLARAAGRIGAS